MSEEITSSKTEKTVDLDSIKHFRQNSDIENFYRFIHDNNLRLEASTLMALVFKNLKKPRKRKSKVLN